MKWLLIVAGLISIASCAINENVDPLPVSQMKEICLMENKGVHMDGFLPEIVSQFERYGVTAKPYTGDLPTTCRFHAEYTANWRWDLAMYLSYAEVRIYDGPNRVGRIEYDARLGGANMGKFGTTESKLGPMFDKLFANK
jgi:hypothetical protein